MKEQLQIQLDQWVVQKAERISAGDLLNEARDVAHFAVFKSKSDANSAASELLAQGFDCFVERDGLFKFLLTASRSDSLLDASVEKFLEIVIPVVEKFGGSYDGFGAEIVD